MAWRADSSLITADETGVTADGFVPSGAAGADISLAATLSLPSLVCGIGAQGTLALTASLDPPELVAAIGASGDLSLVATLAPPSISAALDSGETPVPAPSAGGGGFGWSKDWQRAFEELLRGSKKRVRRKRAQVLRPAAREERVELVVPAERAARARAEASCVVTLLPPTVSAGMRVSWDAVIARDDEDLLMVVASMRNAA